MGHPYDRNSFALDGGTLCPIVGAAMQPETAATQVNNLTLSGQPTRTAANPRVERLFFSGMAVLFLVTVFFGFAQTYYLYGLVDFPHWKRAFAPPHPLIVHIHGIVLSLWFLLLIAQTSLVAAHRVRLHKRLGLAGFALACLVVLVSFAVDCEHLARAYPPGDPRIAGKAGGSFEVIFELIIFAVLVYFGYRYRSHPAAHKRLMLIATINLLPPALARWPVLIHGNFNVALGVTYGLVLVIVMYDLLARGKVHPATLGAGLFYVALRNPLLISIVSDNRTWWLRLAIRAQNLGRHLY